MLRHAEIMVLWIQIMVGPRHRELALKVVLSRIVGPRHHDLSNRRPFRTWEPTNDKCI